MLGSFLVNVLLFAGAILLVKYGGDWLEARPILAKYAKELQTLAGAMLFSPVAIVFLRNTRRAKIRANSARVSSDQFPEIHAVLEQFCAALGVHPAPELYVWEDAPDFSSAGSAWKTHYIVLKPKPLLKDLSAGRDIIEFLIGRELGRIRLGHTRWWDELLTTYVVKIPVLRNPLLQVRMLSQDRYGARLASSAVARTRASRHGAGPHRADQPRRVRAPARGYRTFLAGGVRSDPVRSHISRCAFVRSPRRGCWSRAARRRAIPRAAISAALPSTIGPRESKTAASHYCARGIDGRSLELHRRIQLALDLVVARHLLWRDDLLELPRIRAPQLGAIILDR